MRRLLIGGAVALIIIIAALAGMWVEFNSLQAHEPSIQGSESLIGYHWLANNTEDNATVLAWWDYADGIKEVGNRKPVINEASENIKQTIAGYSTPGKPWRKIEYGLWYPYEPEEKVKDVATFFVTENATESKGIAGKYAADYVLVLYPDDVRKFFAIVMASGENPEDYLNQNFDPKDPESRLNVKETVGTKMIQGDEVDGFEKAFDNGKVRIYRVLH